MKLKFLSGVFALSMLAACTGNKEATVKEEAALAETAPVELVGQWYLENIVLNDTLSVRPEQIAPDELKYIIFTDSAYTVKTGCNTVFGSYTANGDSIQFGAGGSTRMMCPDMTTEQAVLQILPSLATITVENDSVIRLNGGNASQYMEIRKAAAPIAE